MGWCSVCVPRTLLAVYVFDLRQAAINPLNSFQSIIECCIF